MRVCASLAALAVTTTLACEGPLPGDEGCGDPVELRIMSYNVANKSGNTLETIADHITATQADFVALQECANCDELRELLPSTYNLETPRSGVSILYDHSQWLPTHSDFLTLGVDDDGWGERVLHWTRFEQLDSLAAEGSGHCVNVYSTHWCVPIRNPDDECDVSLQLGYAEKSLHFLEERQADRAPSLLAGDFNVFDGFETGAVIEHLTSAGLIDVLRASGSTDMGPTFQGNSWAPAGRLDYIFADSEVDIVDAYIDRSVPDGAGSDHYPVVSTLRFVP